MELWLGRPGDADPGQPHGCELGGGKLWKQDCGPCRPLPTPAPRPSIHWPRHVHGPLPRRRQRVLNRDTSGVRVLPLTSNFASCFPPPNLHTTAQETEQLFGNTMVPINPPGGESSPMGLSADSLSSSSSGRSSENFVCTRRHPPKPPSTWQCAAPPYRTQRYTRLIVMLTPALCARGLRPDDELRAVGLGTRGARP